VQMTTDTAVRVTRMVVQEQSRCHLDYLYVRCSDEFVVPLEKVPYIDFPDLKINAHESTEMPFRYVKDGVGKPIMPKVSHSKRQVLSNQIDKYRACLN
jgi:ribosome biogenesis SPOUT family RNA methylase Rps3